MKNLFTLLLLVCLCHAGYTQSKIPFVTIKNLEGKDVSTESLIDSNQLTVISFWASWCKPCLQELDAISDEYDNWITTTGSRLITVSIDDSRTFASVKNVLVNRGWPFKSYIDNTQQLKRALNITSVPFTIIIDKAGNIIKKRSGYTAGNEVELLDFLKKYNSKKDQ